MLVICGATGFVGRHLLHHSLAAGHNVLAVGRGKLPPPPAGAIYVTTAEWLAAPTSASDGVTMVDLAWDLRARGDLSAQEAAKDAFLSRLAWAQRAGVVQVVALGSAEEFGSAGGMLAENAASAEPRSAYGLAKAESRALLEQWSAQSGIRAWWLRPFLIYGPGQSGNMVLPYVLRQCVRGQHARVSDARQARDFVHVADVCQAILRAIAVPAVGCETLNLGTGIGTPLRSVLAQLADSLGTGHLVDWGAVSRRPTEPDVQIADVSLAADRLSWRATWDVALGMQQLARSAARPEVRAALTGLASAEFTWDAEIPHLSP